MGKSDRCKMWLREHEDLFVDFVRIYLGTGLFVKAIYLMFHRDYLVQIITDSGPNWFAPAAIGHYVIIAHLVGGLMLTFGMATRLAAWVQVPILLGAVFYTHMPRFATIEGRENVEYSALVCFLLVLFGVFGAGRFSFDYFISRKREPVPTERVVATEVH